MILAPSAHAGRSQAAVSGSGFPGLFAEEQFGLDELSGCFLSPGPAIASLVPALFAGPALSAGCAASAGLRKDYFVSPVEPELLFVRPVD